MLIDAEIKYQLKMHDVVKLMNLKIKKKCNVYSTATRHNINEIQSYLKINIPLL